MPIKVTCSNCGGVLHAPDDAGGKRGRCPTCGNILPIPALGGAPAPAADVPRPAPPAARRSFDDVALGDKPPSAPPRPPEPPPRPAAEPRRQSATLPPPADDDRPARKAKPTSPFTKPGTASTAEQADATARAWRKASGGLWWVRLAAWLFLIPILGLNGLRLYEHFSGPLPFDGVLKQEWLPAAHELDLFLFGGPVLLGLLCLVFGRLGFSGAPRKSGARGLALFASLATLVAFGGLVALLFPPVYALIDGVVPPVVTQGEWQLFAGDEALGLIQRFGLTVGLTAVLVAEFWFVGALGRAASSLDNRRFGGRVTRFTLLMGLAGAFLLATGMVRPAATAAEADRAFAGKPGFDFNSNVKQTGGEVQTVVQKEWAGLLKAVVPADFAHWPAVRAGSFLLGGLLVWMMYVRMVGAGRRAIREWREQQSAY